MKQQGCDPRLRGLGLLSQFPDELVAYLMHRLEVPELLALSQTSKLMRVLCCEEPIWLQKHLDRHSQSFSYRVSGKDFEDAAGCTKFATPLPPPPPTNVAQRTADRDTRVATVQGSWRATFLAYHPACGRADVQAADLVPVAAVPGYTSEILYRRDSNADACLCQSVGLMSPIGGELLMSVLLQTLVPLPRRPQRLCARHLPTTCQRLFAAPGSQRRWQHPAAGCCRHDRSRV
jgi:hypothetical protein